MKDIKYTPIVWDLSWALVDEHGNYKHDSENKVMVFDNPDEDCSLIEPPNVEELELKTSSPNVWFNSLEGKESPSSVLSHQEVEFTYEYVLTLHRDPSEGFIVDLRIDKCGSDGDIFDSEYEEGFIFETYKQAFAKYAQLYVKYDAMEGELQPENRISGKINKSRQIKG